MKKPARLTAAFAFVLAAALSAWADYSPLKVGNVWVYQGRTMAGMAMYNPYKVTFDDVGLYWLRRSPSSPGCDNHKRELLLTAFNGRSIDPGIRPPGAILAKEAKIACAVRHPGAVLAFGRAVRGGVGLDMLGRALGLAPQRVPKVPD